MFLFLINKLSTVQLIIRHSDVMVAQELELSSFLRKKVSQLLNSIHIWENKEIAKFHKDNINYQKKLLLQMDVNSLQNNFKKAL